jgi:hypothetical protein
VNPLVRDQVELVPNITHVFTPDQHMYLQYEIYEPAKGKIAAAEPVATASTSQGQGPNPGQSAKSAEAPKTREGIRVLTSIELLQGSSKVFESKPVVASEVNAPDRKAVVFQMDLPLQSLKPGLYLCQVNVIDDIAASFAFPRFPILIREPAPAPSAASNSAN